MMVRGWATENGFVIDNIPIPSISFAQEDGRSNGPIGLINTEMVETLNSIAMVFLQLRQSTLVMEISPIAMEIKMNLKAMQVLV